MDILTILVVGTLNIVCFFCGAKVGQQVSRGEAIQMPDVNPMKAYNEHMERREAEKEQKKLDVILHNIECYDGTDRGQEDVPK